MDTKSEKKSGKRRRPEETKVTAPRKIARSSSSSSAPSTPRDSARGRIYNQDSKNESEREAVMKEFDDDNFAVFQKYKYGKREDYTGDPTWVFIATGIRPLLLHVAQVPEVFELRETVTKLENELQTKEKEWQELFDHHVQTAKKWPTSQ